ncbi:putative ribonuclease H-like domain-containing protein [Tanacetum coccineum]
MLLQNCHFSSKENMRPRTATNADGASTLTIPGPVTTEEKTQKKNDVKARSMLLTALPNEHQLTFNQYKDAKTLFAAIQTRFGGNDATKKTQKTLLKQMYENFNAPSTESLNSIFNRLQKIVSQLAILGENISQEDLNLKFLRILHFEWNTHVVVWRNKPDLDSMSFDDLYNNFKIVEQEVKRITNEVNNVNVQVSTANSSVNTASTHANTANLNDIEEMDLKWQLALLSMRARRYYQRNGKKITINGSDIAGYEKSKLECFNCHKMRHFARECRGFRNQESRARNQDSSRRTVNVEETASKAMVAIDGAGFDWSYMYMANDKSLPTTALMAAFSNSRRNFVPTAVLTKSGIVPVSAARPINTVAPKSFVNAAKTRYLNINSVNTPKGNRVTSVVGEQGFNAVRSLACWLNNQALTSVILLITLDTHAKYGFLRPHNKVDFLQKPTGSEEFHQIVDFLAGSHIRKTANVIVDGKQLLLTEALVRRRSQLANADGISSLPNTEIFDQLTLMGYVSNDDKLTFQKVEESDHKSGVKHWWIIGRFGWWCWDVILAVVVVFCLKKVQVFGLDVFDVEERRLLSSVMEHMALCITVYFMSRMTAMKTKEFIAEMKVLCKAFVIQLRSGRGLLVIAASDDELFLIMEYAQKGSVGTQIHDPQACTFDGIFFKRILDFGLAKLVRVANDVEASATILVGTFGYLAPEYSGMA